MRWFLPVNGLLNSLATQILATLSHLLHCDCSVFVCFFGITNVVH